MARAAEDRGDDALTVYAREFEALGTANDRDEPETLRHLFALTLGHGMRESSGQYCEGRDRSGERHRRAGLFQTSYNAGYFNAPAFDELAVEYAGSVACYTGNVRRASPMRAPATACPGADQSMPARFKTISTA
jgi:hypothetical protein